MQAGKHFTRLEALLKYYVYSEVGQALLQRHEAYVRRHEVNDSSPVAASHYLT